MMNLGSSRQAAWLRFFEQPGFVFSSHLGSFGKTGLRGDAANRLVRKSHTRAMPKLPPTRTMQSQPQYSPSPLPDALQWKT
jgi:hypothetical protein